MEVEGRRPKVLIVDDTKTNVVILVETLRESCQLGVATSGAKALEYAVRNHPDLILLDIMMPEMDGYETCARLKARAETATIPVIFITALSELEDKTKGFELGAVDYITKPFEVVEVQARVRTHLRLEQYKRELEARNLELEEAQERLRFQVRELEARDRLVRAQMNVASSKQACTEILEAAAQVLPCAQAVLYQPVDSGEMLAVTGMRGGKELPGTVVAADGKSLVSRAFLQARPVRDDSGDVAVRLLFRQEPLGVLWLSGASWGGTGAAEGMQALSRLADEASLVLQAARLAEQLENGDLQVDDLLGLDEDI